VKISSIVNRSIPILLFSYPILLLTLRGGVNGCFFLLAIISLYSLAQTKKEHAYETWDRGAIAYSASMISVTLAIFLSQAYHLEFTPKPYDGASRFLLAIPIYLALRRTRISAITVLQYGFPLGAIASVLLISLYPKEWGDHRLGLYFLSPIHFGDLALILGFLSLFSVNWIRKDSAPVLILKVSALIAGIYSSIQTGSRGGWIAIPVLATIFVLCRSKDKTLVRGAFVIALIALASLASYIVSGEIHHRIDDIYGDIVAFTQGNEDTSIGIRFQHWKVAIFLFKQNPIFGVGPDGFSQMMVPFAQSGFITKKAAYQGMGEVHNEILAATVRFGVFGLASILSIYIVPLVIFAQTVKSGSHLKKTAGMLGLCLVTGFLIFGLTVEILDLKMTAAFYSLTVAALLAAATNSHNSDVADSRLE
jgi:O-antigen ligase